MTRWEKNRKRYIQLEKQLPGIIIELKYNGSTDEALRQIEERKYVKRFSIDVNPIIAVGINYDKKTKRHECTITSCMMIFICQFSSQS